MSEEKLTSERRGLLLGVGVTALAGLGLMRSSTAKASIIGEENGPLYAILAQAKVLVEQARKLKEQYYDKHMKVAVDTAKDVNDFNRTTQDVYETIKHEKERLKFGIGSIDEMGKLQAKDYDVKLNALTRMLEGLESFNTKFVRVDRDLSKISGYISPEQKEKATAKKRVYAVITESRTQSVASETKLSVIQKREAESIQRLEKSGSSPIDQVHGVNAVRLTSINDKQDEVIRLLTKTNDLLEAILQHQTTQDVNSRYGDRVRGESHARQRVEGMAKGNWSPPEQKT